jgi:hypothetical protein
MPMFRKAHPVEAVRLRFAITQHRTSGDVRGEVGDWLIESSTDQYIVRHPDFAGEYGGGEMDDAGRLMLSSADWNPRKR